MIIEVYDIEVLSNLFTYTGFDAKKKEWYQFIICEWKNDTNLLYNHLFRDKICQVGFNNEGFDYPVLHHFINHYGEYKTMSGQEVAQKLYNKSQEIIGQEFSVISDKNKYIKQLDLFRIWHYNNKARATSLKDLEIAMRMKNVEEMPIHHTHWCKEGDEIQVLSYNKNDVEATYNFLLTTLGKTEYSLYKGKNKIELRQNNKILLPYLKMQDKDKRCSFLNKENRCMIHSKRPNICRLFPLGRAYQDDDFKYFLQVGNCPKEDLKDVKVKSWIGIENYDENKRFILEWYKFIKALTFRLKFVRDEEEIKAINKTLLDGCYRIKIKEDEDFYSVFLKDLPNIKNILGII